MPVGPPCMSGRVSRPVGAGRAAPDGGVTFGTTQPTPVRMPPREACTGREGGWRGHGGDTEARDGGADSCTGRGVYASLAPGQVVRVLDGCIWSAQGSLPTDRRAYRAVIEGWGGSALLSGEGLHQPMEIRPSG